MEAVELRREVRNLLGIAAKFNGRRVERYSRNYAKPVCNLDSVKRTNFGSAVMELFSNVVGSA